VANHHEIPHETEDICSWGDSNHPSLMLLPEQK